MTEFEKNCYGMTEQEIIEQYIKPNEIFGRPDITIAGILSDCQELLSYTNDQSYTQTEESVRKLLNIAKFCLFNAFEKESV